MCGFDSRVRALDPAHVGGGAGEEAVAARCGSPPLAGGTPAGARPGPWRARWALHPNFDVFRKKVSSKS